MEQLKQAINDQDCLMASLHLATFFQTDGCGPNVYRNKVEFWVEEIKSSVELTTNDPASFQRFIQYFYLELAFSGDERRYFNCKYSLIDQVIDYRTGIPISLAIVLKSMGQSLGFDVQGVNFPGHFLVKCNFPDHSSIYLDPLNGKTLSRLDLEMLYFSILQEMEDENMPEEALQQASTDEIIVRLLHNLKASYINQKRYSNALVAVELLVELCPDDPYERRDRGFLLHQLDCTQVAIEDYRYFIRQCPKDPATHLLEAQLQQLTEQPLAIFH